MVLRRAAVGRRLTAVGAPPPRPGLSLIPRSVQATVGDRDLRRWAVGVAANDMIMETPIQAAKMLEVAAELVTYVLTGEVPVAAPPRADMH